MKMIFAAGMLLLPLTVFANTCNDPKFNSAATILDKDGYTNVRSQPNPKSTIIEKVFEECLISG